MRAGVHSIEHGSLMDDEGVALMAEAGTWLVADIYGGDYIAAYGREHGWKADVLRKNDETTRPSGRRSRSASPPGSGSPTAPTAASTPTG